MAEGRSHQSETRGGEDHWVQSTASIPCRYFHQGNCIYGSNCKFRHGEPPAPAAAAAMERRHADDWVNAPEFVPSWASAPEPEPEAEPAVALASQLQPPAAMSYARAVDPAAGRRLRAAQATAMLCPHYWMGRCEGQACDMIHGDLCELCGANCLHPTDEEQRRDHIEECAAVLEADAEAAFAAARSQDKACGICMEPVWEKQPPLKQRFGLLPNCAHCFCLDCIRTWRGQDKQFESKIIRSCPECRVQSDYVVPSRYWCETAEEKQKLIDDYKKNLSVKACKYFNEGRGECPFGNKCFYLHALPDGTRADVGPPQRKHRRVFGGNLSDGDGDGEADLLLFLLWDFLDERQERREQLLVAPPRSRPHRHHGHGGVGHGHRHGPFSSTDFSSESEDSDSGDDQALLLIH